VSWSPISSEADLEAVVAAAHAKLKGGELTADTRVKVFWKAYEALTAERATKHASNPSVVPIGDFYREVRVQLVRNELEGQPDRKLRYAEFPTWAFVFNFDRYRAESKGSEEHRLGVQTGSQAERSKAMTMNGLTPGEDYKDFCYVLQAGTKRT
jgi:hypothetical protein